MRTITWFFLLLTIVIFGCNSKNNTEELSLEIESLKVENDSIKQLLNSLKNKKNALSGTCFLPYSSKMIDLLNKRLEPVILEIIKECEVRKIEHKLYPKFVKIERTLSTLIIDVEIVANSYHHFLGEAEIINNKTLNLIYTGYNGFCSWGTCTI